MTYDPVAYWTDRGRTFAGEAKDRGWWAALDFPLTGLLRTLRPASVLDVGCGYGRLAAQVRQLWPTARYTGLDVSPDLIEATRLRVPDAELICADLATYEQPLRKWDLVLAVSVLGHLLPADVAGVAAKLRDWARHDLIVMDWDDVGEQTGYQFGHDYRALLPDAARTPVTPAMAIYHVHR